MRQSVTETRLPDLESFHRPGLADVIEAIATGDEEARLVGGTVRNALLGVPVIDIDIATTARPEVVRDRCEAAGMKVVPTGIEHGTVTVVSQGEGYEVTTLREDVETHGRHATVRFGRDWHRDAERRDFTMNALYADLDGTVYDPVGGIEDCLARRVRFIGRAEDRIREDFLRILRFFRFHAAYGADDFDREGLDAAIRLRDELRQLSKERIGHEMSRLVMAPRAAETLETMSDSGFGSPIVGGLLQHALFSRLIAICEWLDRPADLAVRLATLAGPLSEDMKRVAERLKLANRHADRMARMAEAWRRIVPEPDDAGAKEALYRLGPETYRDAALFAFMQSGADVDDTGWRRTVELAETWTAPKFPVAGADLRKAGLKQGPAVGRMLARLESEWVASDYSLDKQALMAKAKDLAD